MNKSTILLLLLFFSCFLKAETQESMVDNGGQSVLIISSYEENVEWSSQMAQMIQRTINDKNPQVKVFIDYLNADVAPVSSALHIKMRTIFRSLANETSTSLDPLDLRAKTIFQDLQNPPDVIVLIGEEAWFTYKPYFILMREDLRHIPIVTTAVSDSITPEIWHPNVPIKWEEMIAIESSSEQSIRIGNQQDVEEAKSYGLEIIKKNGVDVASFGYNMTGVSEASHVEKTLQLINTLIPDLEEILFVDDSYYKSLYKEQLLKKEIKKNYPHVRFKSLIHNQNNTDSIYDEMLKTVKGRAIVTNSFQISPTLSRRTSDELAEQFNSMLSSPIFSFERKSTKDNYTVGGVYPPISKEIKETADIVEKLLAGEKAKSIPFTHIKGDETILNKEALHRFGLQKQARYLSDVTYYNIPPTFFKRHERKIFIIALCLIVLAGCIVLFMHRWKYTRRQKEESTRYKLLFDELQIIYGHSHLDFAIYNKDGSCVIKIINDKQGPKESPVAKELLTVNIYMNTYLSDEFKEQLREGHPINTEITIDSHSRDTVTDSPIAEDKNVYQLLIKPLKSAEEESSYSFMALVVNLTSLMRERREKERIENLLNLASDTFHIGIAFYNPITKKGFANQFWYHNLNETVRTETTVEPTYQHVNSQDRITLWDYMEKVRNSQMQPFQKDIRVEGQDGLEHWVRQNVFQLKFSPLEEDIQIVELNINIDQQKQSETRLNQAKKEADKANKEVEDFLASISHEVRTPLNAIVGFSNVLVDSEEEEEMVQLGDIVRKNNILLTRLINDILELSQFDSDSVRMNYSEIHLNAFIKDLESFTLNALHGKPIRIKYKLPLEDHQIRIDINYFRQLIIQLLSNAAKFTDEGEITIGYHKKENHFYFFVKDTGHGIPQEKQELIFKRFEKLDTFAQGSGLGLPLCKSIVQKMGGEIGVSSNDIKGSTFWFILPENPEG